MLLQLLLVLDPQVDKDALPSPSRLNHAMMVHHMPDEAQRETDPRKVGTFVVGSASDVGAEQEDQPDRDRDQRQQEIVERERHWQTVPSRTDVEALLATIRNAFEFIPDDTLGAVTAEARATEALRELRFVILSLL